jgi:hypothetical protein
VDEAHARRGARGRHVLLGARLATRP